MGRIVVDMGELDRCLLHPHPIRQRDLWFIAGFIKGLRKMDRQVECTDDSRGEDAVEVLCVWL